MGKAKWKGGNMLYPLPAVLVASRNAAGKDNICTVAWTGTVCTNPPMLSISLRPSRLSYEYIMETGVFTVNLTTEAMTRATDYCGVISGRDEDKFETARLTREEADEINCPMVAESPVNIECRVRESMALGSHTMFLADVLTVHADEAYMDDKNKFDLSKADPIVYSHGEYRGIGKYLGNFGYSVRKKKVRSVKRGGSEKRLNGRNSDGRKR